MSARILCISCRQDITDQPHSIPACREELSSPYRAYVASERVPVRGGTIIKGK